jgi:signal peptidase I
MTQPEEPTGFDWSAQSRKLGSAAARGLRETGIVIVTALVLSITLRTFFFQLFYVPSESMLDTLQVGDKIVASKISKTLQGVNRGDVIVFHDPGGWLGEPVQQTGFRGALNKALTAIGFLPSNSGEDLVKRVVAIAGDTVSCCSPNENIMVNGVELKESAYTIGPSSQVEFSITVPKDSVFVLGDNRPNSRDSRFHLETNSGAVPLSEVRGIVVLKLFPFAHFGSVPAPDALTSLK